MNEQISRNELFQFVREFQAEAPHADVKIVVNGTEVPIREGLHVILQSGLAKVA